MKNFKDRRDSDNTLSINQQAAKAMKMMAAKEDAITLMKLSNEKNMQFTMQMIQQLENKNTDTSTLESIIKNCQQIIGASDKFQKHALIS